MLPVADGQQRRLPADERLLDHDAPPRRAKRLPRQLRHDVRLGRGEIGGDEHPLAGGESVRLDYVRADGGAQVGERVIGALEHGEAGGRHTGGGGDLFHVRLRALEPGTIRARTEHEPTESPQAIGQTGDERCLGSDDVEVGLDPLGGRGARLERVPLGGSAPDPWVPRCHDDVGRARAGEGEGVLPGAGPDNADVHAANRTYCSRPGPTPT